MTVNISPCVQYVSEPKLSYTGSNFVADRNGSTALHVAAGANIATPPNPTETRHL